MSSLTGLAQFTNRFAQNIMGYEEEEKREAERQADKAYERNRQQQQDLRTQQTHDVALEGNQINLDQNKIKHKELKDGVTYEQTRNQLAYLKSIGADEQQSIDVLSKAVNNNSKLPYTVEFERDQAGKIIQRQGPDGKPFYFQTIIDKETGEEMGRKMTTLDEATGNYNKLQNAGALEDEIKAAAAARTAKQQEIQDKLTLKAGEAKIDDAKDANKQQREHIYKVDEMGVKHGYTIDELGVKHGFRIDELGVRHANAVDLANVNSQNRIGEYIGRSDVDAGGTPVVNGSGGGWGGFDALIKPESSGQQFDAQGRPLTSSAGAIGIAQVMPATAEYVAKKHGIPWDSRRYKTDANYNYQLGELYFQEQLNRYKDPALAYAAYNAGPGAVNGWLGLPGSDQKKYRAIPGFANMTTEQKINAIPFRETKNYVAKIYRQTGGKGNSVARSVAPVVKQPKGTSKSSQAPAQNVTSAKDYNSNIDKGVDAALKNVKSLGIKPDAATTATYARAGTKLKNIGNAKNKQEFLNLYQEAFDLVISAVPEPKGKGKKMSKADKNALGHKILLSMVGASSLGEFKSMVHGINPRTRSDGTAAGGLTMPQQPSRAASKSNTLTGFDGVLARKQQEARNNFSGNTPTVASSNTRQTSKLQALYNRNLPGVKTDPKAQENLDYLSNLNDNMDW